MKAPIAIAASAGRRYAKFSLLIASVALVAVMRPVAVYWPGGEGWALLGWSLMAE